MTHEEIYKLTMEHLAINCSRFEKLKSKHPKVIVVPDCKYKKIYESYMEEGCKHIRNPGDHTSPIISISFRDILIVPFSEVYLDLAEFLGEE